MSGRVVGFLVEHDFLVKGVIGYLLIGVITPMVVDLLGYLVRAEWLR